MEVRTASPPFDSSLADVILRSADGVHFHVVKAILRLASPIFNDMFTLPQRNPDPDDVELSNPDPSKATHESTFQSPQIPIVDMAETSFVLDRLLRYCYPTVCPRVTDLQAYCETFAVARKFEMEFACQMLTRDFSGLDEAISDGPMKAYTLACKYRLGDVASLAAKEALRKSLDDLLAEDVVIDDMSTQEYDAILQYHRKCRIMCGDLVSQDDFRWLQNGGAYGLSICQCETSSRSFRVRFGATLASVSTLPSTFPPPLVSAAAASFNLRRPKWWFDHIDKIADVFKHKSPLAPEIFDVSPTLKIIETSRCPHCQKTGPEELRTFTADLQREINDIATKGIPLNIAF
ncbi:hypothetical protein EYR38_003302 [Pleurotus pulmonarius]|nr:hypothetical protein EYR38_003302 [Pleurotus pulmonarius]